MEGRMSLKTRHCDECEHYDCGEPLLIHCGLEGSAATPASCAKEHKLRFYYPKGPMDDNWGHKRKCADFSEIPINRRGPK